MDESSSIEYFERTPFKEPIVQETDGTNIIASFRSDPEKIVRMPPYETEKPGVEAVMDRTNHGASLFRELSEKYGINVVNHSHVIGHNVVGPGEGRFQVYTVAERVHGVSLGNVDLNKIDKENFVIQLSQLYRGLIQYYFDKYQTEEDSIHDITSPGQYMYGRVQGDTEAKIYLVDVDGFHSNDAYDKIADILEIAGYLKEIEDFFGIDLSGNKRELHTKIEALPLDNNFEPELLRKREEALGVLRDSI